MSWKNTILFGAITGMLVSTFIIVIFIIAQIDPGSFAGLFAIFFGMATLSAVFANQILKISGRSCLSLKILVPIGFLTSIIPLLGATFGAPNSEPSTLIVIVLLGAAGGIFWSIPFAGWDYWKSRGNGSTEQE